MITFNGQTYNSPDEMPPDVRKMFEETLKIFGDNNQDGEPDLFNTPFVGDMLRQTFADQDADGVPDIMQGQFSSEQGPMMSAATVIVYEGKTYNSIDELPASAQAEIRQKMAQMDVAPIYVELEKDDQPGRISPMPSGAPVAPGDEYPAVKSDQLESRSLLSLPLILFLSIGCLALLLFGIYYLLQR